MMISIARRCQSSVRRRLGGADEGVAMVSVILFMILLSGLSLVLLGVIVGQMGPAYAAQKGTKTVYAAQAGLQSGLSAVRAATKVVAGKTVGDLTKLPCRIKAGVDGTGDSEIGYTVRVDYYTQDPTGKSEAWLASAANKLACTSTNYAGSTQPRYAYIVSSGYGESAVGRNATESNRSVAAIYKFQISNVNIPGGRMFTYDRSACMQADATTAGSRIRFLAAASCATNDNRQLWAYGADWKIKLASSIVNPGDPGMCVTARPGEDSNFATLQPCVTTPLATHSKQLFSWNGSAGWSGQNAANTGPSGCLTRANATVGGTTSSYLLATSPCTQFAPDPAVGAGAASYNTKQVVNYKEFGRCLDVTDTEITREFMISYPCKQDPTGSGSFDWNHKWFYTEPDVAGGETTLGNQRIIVYRANSTSASNTYCLTAPANTAAGKYPVFSLCNASNARQNWTRVNKKTGDYVGSYLFTDTFGRCLTADANDKMPGTNWSKITVAGCNGGLEQKWNAPAIENSAEFGGFKETDGYKELG
jgi:hypothetical protein